jgi:hypothetical protein
MQLTEPRILIGETFCTCPEEFLKHLFVEINGTFEDDGKTVKKSSISSIGLHNSSDAVVNAPIVPNGSYITGDQQIELSLSQGVFCADARELSLLDQIAETIG